MFHAAVVYASPHACRLLHCNFFIFLGESGAVGRGSGGGVRSVTVGVQFQRHPSRRSRGGVNPNLSAESVS